MTLRFPQDWERIKSLKLQPDIQTVAQYETCAIRGLSYACDYFKR